MPRLIELLPEAEVLLSLDPEELGGLLLQVIASTPWQNQGKFHPNNSETQTIFGTNGRAYLAARQDEVVRAVGDAPAWLEAQVLILSADGMLGSQGWRMLSRRGRRLATTTDWENYRKAGLLPKPLLHPAIADEVYFDFCAATTTAPCSRHSRRSRLPSALLPG